MPEPPDADLAGHITDPAIVLDLPHGAR